MSIASHAGIDGVGPGAGHSTQTAQMKKLGTVRPNWSLLPEEVRRGAGSRQGQVNRHGQADRASIDRRCLHRSERLSDVSYTAISGQVDSGYGTRCQLEQDTNVLREKCQLHDGTHAQIAFAPLMMLIWVLRLHHAHMHGPNNGHIFLTMN